MKGYQLILYEKTNRRTYEKYKDEIKQLIYDLLTQLNEY